MYLLILQLKALLCDRMYDPEMFSLNVIVSILILPNNISSQALQIDIKLPAIEYNNDRISECVKQVFKKQIPTNNLVFMVSSHNYHKSLLRSINTHYQVSVVTRTFDQQKWLVYPDIYILSIKNYIDFITGFRELSKDLSWNPRAKFIIICKNIRNNTSEIFEVFKVLLRKNVFNVLLIQIQKSKNLELLTYYPYSGSNCGQNASDIRSFGYCQDLRDTPLFPNKVPNGLRNCTLVVAAREAIPSVIFKNGSYSKYFDIGIEQYVLNIITQYEGIQIKYMYVDRKEGNGVVLPNKTITGLIGYLQSDKVNVIIGGLFLIKNRMEIFDFIYGYNYAIFSIFTPVLQEQKWTRVYRQFSLSTWMLIILSFVFTAIVILKTISLTSGKPKDKFIIIMKLWLYFYGQVDDNLFRNKYLKRIMIVWIIFTNSICAFYNTASYSLITGHVQQEIKVDPNNLASLPLKACLSKEIITFFLYAFNETFPKSDTSRQCENTSTELQSVASRTDLFTINTGYTYALEMSKYEDADGRPTLKKKDFPRNLIYSMYMTKGFPLRNKFQTYALEIYEKGILQRDFTNMLSKKRKPVSNLQRKFTTIRLEDFVIPFSILIIGSVVSFVCFLIELKIDK